MMGSHPRHRRRMHTFLGAMLLAAVCLVAAGCSSNKPGSRGTSPARSSPVTATSLPAAAPPFPSATSTASAPNSTAPVRAQLEPWTVPAPRYRTMGTALGDSVFLLGGLDVSGVSSSDVYRVQPSTGSVTLAGRLATPTHGAAA